MSFVYYNPNPEKKTVGDCVIRGLTILLGDTWENVYTDLCMQGAYLHDMPNSNAVWGDNSKKTIKVYYWRKERSDTFVWVVIGKVSFEGHPFGLPLFFFERSTYES